MADQQHEQRAGTTAAVRGPGAPSPIKSHPATGMVQAMLASGVQDVAAYAALLQAHPEARADILTLLHGSLGNAFVQRVMAQPAGAGPKPKAKPGHVLVESEGAWEQLKGHDQQRDGSYGGFSKYGGGRVRDKLTELTNAGLLKLTPTQIAVFDAVSQVETGGQIGCVQTYDDQVVSVGFKQVVLGHGSLEKMMVRAPKGFAKHGLQLDFAKTYKKSGWSKQPHQIVGCANVEELRSPAWAIKFYHASMEPDVIAAMCELLAEEQGTVDRAIDREGGAHAKFLEDATAQAWLLEVYNNRPAFTAKAIERASATAAAHRDAFLDVLADAIVDTYVVEEPLLHYRKAKKAAQKKGTQLTEAQDAKLLADNKKKYEPIGRRKGTNIVTKIGRKVTPVKLAAAPTTPAAAGPTSAPARGPTAMPASTPPMPASAAPAVATLPAEHTEHTEHTEHDDAVVATAEVDASAPAITAPAEPALADARTAPVVEAAATHAPQPFRVTARGLNVRASASTEADIVGGLKRGDVVDVVGRDGRWLTITHEGQPAFVHGDYVAPVDAVAASRPAPRVPTDAARQTTRPPKAAPPSPRADETPWWFEEETRARPQADAAAAARTGVEIATAVAQGALNLVDMLDPFDWFGGGEPRAGAAAAPTTSRKPAGASPASTAPKPTPTAAKPTPASPVPALSPRDLHDETLERMVATLNHAQVTAIAGELAGLQAKSRELQGKAHRKEERGKGRDELVAGIRVLRGKLDALASVALDKQQVTAFKAAVYRELNEIAPYYFQSRNIDILETPPVDKTRTCNVTCLGMALESLGRTPEDFTGNRAAVLAAARVYQHKIVGDDVSDPAFDATAGTGASWTNVAGMRFPDFLELVAIANEMGGDLTDAGVKAGAKLAWNSILNWKNLEDLAELFGANAARKMFNATGIKANRKAKTKADHTVLDQHGDKNRMAVERYINARNLATATGSKRHEDKAEGLRTGYERAVADDSIDDRLSLAAYRDHIVETIGGDLDSGAAVIVGLSGHFVRLQAIHADHVIVDDPARDTRSATKLSFAEARAMGYFHMRFVIR